MRYFTICLLVALLVSSCKKDNASAAAKATNTVVPHNPFLSSKITGTYTGSEQCYCGSGPPAILDSTLNNIQWIITINSDSTIYIQGMAIAYCGEAHPYNLLSYPEENILIFSSISPPKYYFNSENDPFIMVSIDTSAGCLRLTTQDNEFQCIASGCK